MAEDQNARFKARPGQEIAGESFGEAFKRHKAAGRADFSWRGQTYTTKTAQEQGREIGAKAAAGSGRGTSGGRTADDQDTAPLRGEAAPEPPLPAARPRASLSDIPGLIARGMAEGAERVPAGRGLGAAFTGAGAAYRGLKAAEAVSAAREAARRTAETGRSASRIDPMLATGRVPETGRFRATEAPLSRARQQVREEMAAEPQLKRGGKVKAYAKGGSVKGAGCEQRGLRKCKVY